MEKYKDKSMGELGKLFFELGNEHLVPQLSNHIEIALEKFKVLQENDGDLFEFIIVADVDEKQFVFALGDGADLESDDDDCVFYIAKSDEFNECMELLNFICFGNHPDGYLGLDGEVYHWIGDAMPEIEGTAVTIYGGYDYGESEVDPFWESDEDDEYEDEDEYEDDEDSEDFDVTAPVLPENKPDLTHLDINYPVDISFIQDENPTLSHFILEQFKCYMSFDEKGINFVERILSEGSLATNFVKVIAGNLYLTFAKEINAKQCYTMMIMPANEMVTGAFDTESGYTGKCSKEFKFFIQDIISRL